MIHLRFQTIKENLLRNDQNLTDITLATIDDKQVRAHKIILSSSSIKNILHTYDMQD